MWTELQNTQELALVVIDLQEFDIDPNCGALATQSHKVVSQYLEAIHQRVLPNVQALLKAARERQVEIIHVRIQSLTQDGRDRSLGHKRLGIHIPPSSIGAQFIKEVEPKDDEIILNKTSSDAFHTTPLAQILRNMGVKQLVFCGVFTSECVASTARSACDLSFDVRVVGDACAAVTDEEHQQALFQLHDRYAQVIDTQTFISALKNIP